jgi:hypothetical protein
MRRTCLFLSTVLLVFALFVASPASALPVSCWFGVVDITTVSGQDPDGTSWEYVTFWYAWSCTDGYLDDERPYDPSTVGGGTPTPPPPSLTPTPGCSVTTCISECNAHYMADAHVEVIGETIIEHYNGSCGILCMESSRLDWEACKGMCVTDCNLP